MPKRFSLLFCCFPLVLMVSRTRGAELYVAPNGADTNPGTLQRPFRTIQKAADIAQAGDTVRVRAGTYRETVRPAHSGTAGKPVVFAPYAKENAVVSGAALINSGWKSAGDGLYFTDWPGVYASVNNQSDAVFVGGRMVNPARWPEETHHNLSRPREGRIAYNTRTVKTAFKSPGPEYDIYDTTFFDPDFNEPDGRWKGAKVWACNGGATDTQDGDGLTGLVLDTNRAEHTITIRAPVSGPVGKANLDYSKDYQIGTGTHYYLFDPTAADGLRHPGEFWHDRAANRLYLRTPDGSDPAGLRVEVKQRDYGFDLDPDGTGRRYITVKGFGLFACSVTTDKTLGTGAGNGGNRRGVGPSSHLLFDGLNAQYVTHFTDQSGNLQTQWGQSSGLIISGTDCEIRNSVVAWSAGSGIVVTGRRCRAINNLVHDVVYAATDCGGISTGAQYGGSDSLDIEIGYNTIYNVGVDGIECTSLTNADPNRPGMARIHHNIIHDAVLQVADSAAIHEVGHDGQWVRIDHNVIYDLGSIPNGYLYSGIYLDYAPNDGNAPARYIFDHNVIYNVSLPIEINHPNAVLVANNTLLDVAKHGPIQSNGGGFENVILRNNLCSNPFAGVPDHAVKDHNVQNAADAIFVDAANSASGRRNYQVVKTAVSAIGTGTKTFVNTESAPDLGAYAFGKPRWRAGYEAGDYPAPDAPLPALLPEAFQAGANVFPQGDFDHCDPADTPLGWQWTRYGNVSVVQEAGGNRYLHIGRELKDRTVQAFAHLPLKPDWKRMRVSARLKVKNLVRSANGLTASVIVRVEGKDNKMLGYAAKLALTQDTDWVRQEAEFVLPAGADHLDIEVSSIGTDGEFSADDIAFVPLP